jgi:hypothetical protein
MSLRTVGSLFVGQGPVVGQCVESRARPVVDIDRHVEGHDHGPFTLAVSLPPRLHVYRGSDRRGVVLHLASQMMAEPMRRVRAERESALWLEQVDRSQKAKHSGLRQVLDVDPAAGPSACGLVDETTVRDDDRAHRGTNADGTPTPTCPGEGSEQFGVVAV